ncbi:MAG: ABC transporter permease [Anaerolineaceae bacterium]
MESDLLQLTFIVSLLSGMVRITTPILLAALGELVAERAGVLNMGVEGTMLMGAYVGFMVAAKTGSLVWAVLAAMLTGALMSLILAFMTISLKVDQTVTGLALNLFASGISFYWLRVAFKNGGGSTLPSIEILNILPVPLLSKIPIIGEIFFQHNLLTYIAFLMVPVIWFVLYRTNIGLQLRCLGENPRALDMKGVNVPRMQYGAVIFGGMMAGLGGSVLTLGSTGLFVPEISAGRGWLAIVIVIAGNWLPGRILLSSMFFALLDSLQLQVQGIGIQFPYQFLLMLPYVIAVLALIVGRARSLAPRWLGTPYSRE